MAIRVTDAYDKLQRQSGPLKAGTYGEATLVVPDRSVGALLSVNIVTTRLARLVTLMERVQKDSERRDRQARDYAEKHSRRIDGLEATAAAAASSRPGGVVGSSAGGPKGGGGGGPNLLEALGACTIGKRVLSFVRRGLLGTRGSIVGLQRLVRLGMGAVGAYDVAKSVSVGKDISGWDSAALGFAIAKGPGAIAGYVLGDIYNSFRDPKGYQERAFQDMADNNKWLTDQGWMTEPEFAKSLRKDVQDKWHEATGAVATAFTAAWQSFSEVAAKWRDKSVSWFEREGEAVAVWLGSVGSRLKDSLSKFNLTDMIKEWLKKLGNLVSGIPTTSGDNVLTGAQLDAAYADEKGPLGVMAQPEAARGRAYHQLGAGSVTRAPLAASMPEGASPPAGAQGFTAPAAGPPHPGVEDSVRHVPEGELRGESPGSRSQQRPGVLQLVHQRLRARHRRRAVRPHGRREVCPAPAGRQRRQLCEQHE